MNTRKYISYSDLKDSIFTKNLFALVDSNGPLVMLLEAEQIHDKLRIFNDDKDFANGEYFVNRKFTQFYRDPPKLQIPTFYDEWLDIQKPALLFGIGLGYGLKYLLDKSTIPKLYVYERDKSLLKVALTLNDYASQIVAKRLVIVPQEEIFTLVGKGIEVILPEPLLFRENKVEYLTISRMIKSGNISTRRAVIFSGTLYILDCAVTLYDQGWDVFEIDPDILSTQMTHYLLDVLNPDLLFQINLLYEIEQFSQKRVVVEWEIDPIASPIPPVESSEDRNLFVFTQNPEHIAKYQEMGYSHFEYLSLCANPHKFFPNRLNSDSQKRFGCDVSFGGSLMLETQQTLLTVLLDTLSTLSREENKTWENIHAWITKLISNPPVGSKNLQLIEELENLLKASELPEAVKINESYLVVTAPVAEFLAYLWRKQVVSAIVPFGIHIWGKEEWKNEFAQNYRGKADHYLDLPKIYIASKINLDISRINQPNIVTMRVFDVLACGGFVLADRNETLLELFKEDWDIVCFDTPEEAVDKINYYLNHENDRLTIAQRGYDNVVNSHTFEHRINHILNRTGLMESKL